MIANIAAGLVGKLAAECAKTSALLIETDELKKFGGVRQIRIP